MYAIAGVSGHTGSVVANTLLAAGKSVRVIVRDAAKGEVWKRKGADVAIASLDDRAALAAALKGAEGAYLLIPPNGFTETNIPANRARTTQAILGAVQDARPGHVVFLSSNGAQHAKGTGPIQYLKPLEDGLRASGVPTTILRAAFFMENWAAVAQGAVQSGTLYYALSTRISQVATTDIGKTAARLLVEGGGKIEGAPKQPRIVNLAGPADLTLEEVAAALSKVAGKPIAAVTVPPSAMVESLVGMGASRELAELYGEMAAAMKDGKIEWEGEPIRGSITLEQRLRELLAA
jgi:uncharacterized protein YbjT (DUF2867 family)